MKISIYYENAARDANQLGEGTNLLERSNNAIYSTELRGCLRFVAPIYSTRISLEFSSIFDLRK